MEIEILKETALEAAAAAASLVRQGLATDAASLSVEHKGAVDLVTAVDREAEAAIVRILRSRTPQAGILAEEGGRLEGGKASHVWVIDPLDGTTNFAHRHPHCAVSVACLEDGRPIVGVVHDPGRGEVFAAVRGQGAWLDGRRLRVSRETDLAASLLATGFPYDRRTQAHRYIPLVEAFLRASQGVRRMGAASLDLAWVACGRLDGFWEVKLHPWDVAAGVLLVEEAGGRVSDYRGEPLDVLDPARIVASNALIHTDMMATLQGHRALWQDS